MTASNASAGPGKGIDYLVTLRIEPDGKSTTTTALVVPTQHDHEIPQALASTRYAEYATGGTTKQDQQAADAYYQLSQGTILISLAESIAASVITDRADNRMVRLAICRADATEVVGLYHPDGTWEIAPNRGPKFEFKGMYESRPNLRARRVMVRPPVLRPQYRTDLTKFLLWTADWRIQSPPPGTIYLVEQITANLFAIRDQYEYTAADSFVLGGIRK